MIKLKEGQKVYGTDGKQYLIERGDMVKTLHINEGSNKLPYDVLIDGIVDQDTGFNVRQYKNKNYRSFTVTKGTPYEFVYVNNNSDGSVMFRINIFTEIGDTCYSCLAYDSVKDARHDGWPV